MNLNYTKIPFSIIRLAKIQVQIYTAPTEGNLANLLKYMCIYVLTQLFYF